MRLWAIWMHFDRNLNKKQPYKEILEYYDRITLLLLI